MLTSSAPAFLHPQMNNWIPLNICIPQVCSLSMDWANSSDRLETRLWKYQSRVHCKIIIPHTNPHDVNKARQAQLLLLLQPKLSQAQEEMPASQGYRLKVQEQSPDPNSDSLHYICFLWFIRSHATLPPRDMTKKKIWLVAVLFTASCNFSSECCSIWYTKSDKLYTCLPYHPTLAFHLLKSHERRRNNILQYTVWPSETLSISVHYRCSPCGSTSTI